MHCVCRAFPLLSEKITACYQSREMGRRKTMSFLSLRVVAVLKLQDIKSLESFVNHRSLGLSQFLISLFGVGPETCTSNKFLSAVIEKFRNWCFSLRIFWDFTASDSALVDLLCFCQSDLILRCTAGDSAVVDLLCSY